MADTPVQMTRAEYEATYGAAVPTSAPVEMTADYYDIMREKMPEAPIQMTRAEYEQSYGLPAPGGGPQSPIAAYTGGVGNIANAATFGFGDEILGAAAAPFTYAGDKLFGSGEMSLGDSYSAARNILRADTKEFREENPLTAALGSLSGALTLPIGSTVKSGSGLVNSLTNIGKMGAEGATYGAASQFGEGEGGAMSRLRGTGDAALNAGMVSAALGVPVEAGRKVLGLISREAPSIAKAETRRAFGASVKDFTKSGRQQGLMRMKSGDIETRLSQAFEKLKDEGILQGARDPKSLLQNHDAVSNTLGGELRGFLNQADDALGGRRVFPKKFSFAEEYISKEVPFDDRGALRKDLANYIKSLRDESTGTINALQDQKEVLYRKAYPEGSDIREGLDKAIAKDLRQTIEDYTDALLPNDLANAVKFTNRKLAPYEETRRILEEGVTRLEGRSFMSKVWDTFKTTGGGGSPMIIGTYLGGVPGFVAGLGATLGAKHLSTPQGAGKIADLAKKFPDVYSKMPAYAGEASKVAGALIASNSRDTRKLQSGPRQRMPIQAAQKAQMGQKGKAIDQSVTSRGLQGNSSYNNSRPKSETTQPISYTPKEIKALVKDEHALVRAIIDVESSFDHKNVSPVGAKGLMQLMPDNVKHFGVKDPFDPSENIKAGKALLKEEFERYDHDPRLALAAYNYGSTKLNRSIKRAGSKTWADVSRFVPLETRQYVTKVLSKYRQYAKT